MQCISIVGTPGSGKTTLGRRLSACLTIPFVELDQIHFQEGWKELSDDDFRATVSALAATNRWIIDGNYPAVRDLVWKRADTVIWLDLPRRVVFRRLILRTLRRACTRERQSNGNRERIERMFRWNPNKNIIRWAWVEHPKYTQSYGAATNDPSLAHVDFIRLRTPEEVLRFLERLTVPPNGSRSVPTVTGQRARTD